MRRLSFDRITCVALAGALLGSPLASADPAPAQQTIPFDQALERIVARSTAVSGQKALEAGTRAKGLPARLVFLPSLSFDASTHYYGSGSSAYIPPGQSITYSQLEGTSQWNLFHWGSDYEGLRAAQADETTQQALLDSAVLKAEDDGAKALFDEIESAQEVGILQELARSQEQSLSVARQRYAASMLPQQEVDKVEVDLENARSRLADAQVREAASRSALENLLGPAEVEGTWPWKDELARARELPLGSDDEVAQLLSARPDWRAAEARVDAEARRSKQAWRLIFPSLDANAAYGYYGQSGFSYTSGWTGGLSITVPFFDHLQLLSNARVQDTVRESAESSLEQTRRDARSDWETARRSFGIAVDSALAREKTLSLSRRIYQENLRRFQAGRASANDLTLDENRLSDSELLAAQGWNTAHLAYLRLCHSKGLRLSRCR